MNAKIVGCSYIGEIKIENGNVVFVPTGKRDTKTDSTMLSILDAIEVGYKTLKLVPVNGFKSDDTRVSEFVFAIEDVKAITLSKIITGDGKAVYRFDISLPTLRRMILDAKYKHTSTTEFVTDLA